MEGRSKRVMSYDDDGPGKRHQGDDHGHLSRPRVADSRSLSPQGAPRSRSPSPKGAPPPRYGRGGSPRGPRNRSFSPHGPPNGNGDSGRSKVCLFWRQSDSCKFGANCNFAHNLGGIKGRVSPSPLEGPPPDRRPRQFHGSPDRNGGGFARRGGRDDRGPPMRRGGMSGRPRSRSPHGGPGGPGGPRGGPGGPRGGPGGPRGGPGGPRGPIVCSFWKENDNCKFGDQCKFLHSFPEPNEFGRGPPPRRGFPPQGRPQRRSFSPPRQNFPPRGPRMSPGRDGGRPIVWNHDVSPRQQRNEYEQPSRHFSPPRQRRERSPSPRRYERGPSPGARYMSPPPARGYSPGRYHSPPRRMSPRGRSPPPPRYDGHGHGSPRGRRDHFSPPTQYRGQPGPKRKREICYFFTQKQGCRNADQCNFIHAKPEAGDRIERPERRDRPPPRAEQASPASRDSSPA